MTLRTTVALLIASAYSFVLPMRALSEQETSFRDRNAVWSTVIRSTESELPREACNWDDGPTKTAAISEGTIAVLLHYSCGDNGAVTRDIVVLLSSSTGDEVRRKVFQNVRATAFDNQLNAIGRGLFLVRLGSEVILLDDALIEKAKIQFSSSASESWLISERITNGLALLRRSYREQSENLWLRGGSLELERREAAAQYGQYFVVAGDAVFYAQQEAPDREKNGYQRYRSDLYKHTMGSAVDTKLCTACDLLPLTLLDHDMLLAEDTNTGALLLTSVSGQRKAILKLGRGEELKKVDDSRHSTFLLQIVVPSPIGKPTYRVARVSKSSLQQEASVKIRGTSATRGRLTTENRADVCSALDGDDFIVASRTTVVKVRAAR